MSMHKIIHSGLQFFKDHNAPYDLLRYFDPGVSVDVGAAEGQISRRMATAQPRGEVIAYEPFSGNLPHFRNHTEGLENIELRTKAVGDRQETCYLNVPSVLTGHEKGWEGRSGYSSGGTLLPSKDQYGEEVFVTTLDEEIDRPIRFLKIDVQGYEINVLKGAQSLFQKGIDLIFVEYEGDSRIIEFLAEKQYSLFDSGFYTYSQKLGGPSPEHVSPYFRKSTVASGRPVAQGAVVNRPLSADDYVGWFGSFGAYALHTDLLAVRPGIERSFFSAASKLFT